MVVANVFVLVASSQQWVCASVHHRPQEGSGVCAYLGFRLGARQSSLALEP